MQHPSPWFESLEGRLLASATPTLGPGLAAAALVMPLRSGAALAATAQGLDAEQKRRANQLISTYENSTTTLQYGYLENIHDGRGYTAGRAGFTTATGDFLLVVQRYTARKPHNPLVKYLPRLRQLARSGSDSVARLAGIASAWHTAARTALFRSVQDQVVDEQYYLPAVQRWQGIGAIRALTLVAIYDTIIQHGEGDDPDGLPALMDRATARAGGTPADGVAEAAWLGAFLTERYRTLSHATDPATRAGWRQSRDRVRVLKQLLAAGNLDFAGPLVVTVYGDRFVIP